MKIVLIFLSTALIFSCEQNSTQEGERKVRTIDKQIRTNANGIPDVYYPITRTLARAMNLDDLEKGFDSLQIRIWLACRSKASYQQVIVLKLAGANWHAELYQFLPNNGHDSLRVLSYNKKNVEPRSGWPCLSDSLMRLKILELPDMASVSEMKMTALDASADFVMEVATPTVYRLCTYNNLNYYVDKNVWPSSNMARFIRLLASEFKFPCAEVQD
jgi:hypothetical protein